MLVVLFYLTMSVFQSSIIFVFFCIITVQSDSFEKKVVMEDAYCPGVMKYQDTYYMVRSYSYDIITSKNLVTWKIEKNNSLFDEDNYPKWNGHRNIISPEMRRVGNKFNLYFYGLNKKKDFVIGVATADTPLGLFKDISEPLLTIDQGDAMDLHVAEDGNHSYLIVTGTN